MHVCQQEVTSHVGFLKPWRYGCEAQSLPDACSLAQQRQTDQSASDTMASALSMRTFVPVRTCRPVARPSLRARRVVAMAAPSVSAAALFLPVHLDPRAQLPHVTVTS